MFRKYNLRNTPVEQPPAPVPKDLDKLNAEDITDIQVKVADISYEPYLLDARRNKKLLHWAARTPPAFKPEDLKVSANEAQIRALRATSTIERDSLLARGVFINFHKYSLRNPDYLRSKNRRVSLEDRKRAEKRAQEIDLEGCQASIYQDQEEEIRMAMSGNTTPPDNEDLLFLDPADNDQDEHVIGAEKEKPTESSDQEDKSNNERPELSHLGKYNLPLQKLFKEPGTPSDSSPIPAPPTLMISQQKDFPITPGPSTTIIGGNQKALKIKKTLKDKGKGKGKGKEKEKEKEKEKIIEFEVEKEMIEESLPTHLPPSQSTPNILLQSIAESLSVLFDEMSEIKENQQGIKAAIQALTTATNSVDSRLQDIESSAIITSTTVSNIETQLKAIILARPTPSESYLHIAPPPALTPAQSPAQLTPSETAQSQSAKAHYSKYLAGLKMKHLTLDLYTQIQLIGGFKAYFDKVFPGNQEVKFQINLMDAGQATPTNYQTVDRVLGRLLSSLHKDQYLPTDPQMGSYSGMQSMSTQRVAETLPQHVTVEELRSRIQTYSTSQRIID